MKEKPEWDLLDAEEIAKRKLEEFVAGESA